MSAIDLAYAHMVQQACIRC